MLNTVFILSTFLFSTLSIAQIYNSLDQAVIDHYEDTDGHRETSRCYIEIRRNTSVNSREYGLECNFDNGFDDYNCIFIAGVILEPFKINHKVTLCNNK